MTLTGQKFNEERRFEKMNTISLTMTLSQTIMFQLISGILIHFNLTIFLILSQTKMPIKKCTPQNPFE